MSAAAGNPLNIESRLQEVMQQQYPRFSDNEYARRQAALAAAMEKHGCDHLLVVTDHRAGNAVQWLTGWPGTVEAYVVFKPGERMVMHMEWFNHFPLGRKIARDVDVRWGQHQGIALTIEELKRRGAKRVGLIGPLVVSKFRHLEAAFEMKLLDADYTQLRMRKSEEEIDWLRIGAALSDAGLRALVSGTRVGMDERELGALNFSSAGVGSGTHLNLEKLKLMAKINMNHVPYKGSAEALADVLGNRVDFYFAPISTTLAHVQGGRVRAIAVSTIKRSSILPNIPTIAESGVPGFDFSLWFGIWAPTGVPQPIISKISQSIKAAGSDPAVKQKLAGLGNEPMEMDPAQFAKFVRSEIEVGAKVLQAAGIKPQ